VLQTTYLNKLVTSLVKTIIKDAVCFCGRAAEKRLIAKLWLHGKIFSNYIHFFPSDAHSFI